MKDARVTKVPQFGQQTNSPWRVVAGCCVGKCVLAEALSTTPHTATPLPSAAEHQPRPSVFSDKTQPVSF